MAALREAAPFIVYAAGVYLMWWLILYGGRDAG